MEIYSTEEANQEKDKSLDPSGRSHTGVASDPRSLTTTYSLDHFTRPSRHMEQYDIGNSRDGIYRDLGYHALRLTTRFPTYHEEASYALRLTGSMIAPINERVVVTHQPQESALSDAATAYSARMTFGRTTITNERDVIAGCHGPCSLRMIPTVRHHQLRLLFGASTSVKQGATTANALVLHGAVLGASGSDNLLVDENDRVPLSQNSLRYSPHTPTNDYPKSFPPSPVGTCHSIDTVSSCTQNGTEYSGWTPPSILAEDDGGESIVDISSERLWEAPSSVKYIAENGLKRRDVVDAGASDSSKRLRARSSRQSTQSPGWDLSVRTQPHNYAISSFHTMQRHSQPLRWDGFPIFHADGEDNISQEQGYPDAIKNTPGVPTSAQPGYRTDSQHFSREESTVPTEHEAQAPLTFIPLEDATQHPFRLPKSPLAAGISRTFSLLRPRCMLWALTVSAAIGFCAALMLLGEVTNVNVSAAREVQKKELAFPAVHDQPIAIVPDVIFGLHVVDDLTSQTHILSDRLDVSFLKRVFGYKVAIPLPASTVLDSDLRAGRCWPMSGSSGHLGLQSMHTMHITNVTIGHISMTSSRDICAAPRSIILWGLSDVATIGQEMHRTSTSTLPMRVSLPAGTRMFPLAIINYDVHSSFNIQTFDVDSRFHEYEFKLTILEVLSNWGRSDYTCLYSIRLHGWT